jgi:hypothetical protein
MNKTCNIWIYWMLTSSLKRTGIQTDRHRTCNAWQSVSEFKWRPAGHIRPETNRNQLNYSLICYYLLHTHLLSFLRRIWKNRDSYLVHSFTWTVPHMLLTLRPCRKRQPMFPGKNSVRYRLLHISWVRSPAKPKYFVSILSVQISSEAHSASYPMGIRGPSRG